MPRTVALALAAGSVAAAAGAPAGAAAAVRAAARACAEELSADSGPAFAACTEAAFHRGGGRGAEMPRDYDDLVRDFVCARDGGGTAPARTAAWRDTTGGGPPAARGAGGGGACEAAPDGAAEPELASCGAPEPAGAPAVRVEVVRELPLVAVVRGFASKAECRALVRAGGDESKMRRAEVETNNNRGRAGNAQVRRSYSSAIPHPPRADSELGRLVARMFAVVRNLTGYDFRPEGQEPMSVNLYKDEGDEFRMHCDGACLGEPYTVGERAATSLLYCRAARRGGATSFMEGALKIAPRRGDLLVFTYRDGRAAPAGAGAVHSACPLREGKKWVATQWYREGVNATFPAAAAEAATRHLRRVGRPPWIRGG